MTLLKDKLSEAKNLYLLYWESYMNGELETFVSTLDEDFEMIGTSESEVAHSKAEGIAFFKAQLEEVVGKADMRNRQISAKALGDMVLVNETCDIYVLGEPDLPADSPYLSVGKQDWTFYSKIRISTLLHETNTGWKVIQQHGSLPDMRVQEGETIAFEKITKENLELRDAIKRRTIELENKTKELEIEAALERVRTVAMGMKKPEDMLDICRIISEQLRQFGVEKIRNIQTAIIDEEKGIYLCYQYFTPYDKKAVERTAYLKSPVEHGMVRQMLASKDGHFTGTLAGKELEEFREHRKAENHFPDPLLDKAKELDYCFLSIGQGGLGLTLYQPLDAVTLSLFQRFHQVFSLAFQRFRDIQKAEAQAREAQIEAALERVRSRSLAMHHSSELSAVVDTLLQEFTNLEFTLTFCIINLIDEEDMSNTVWAANPETGKDAESYYMKFEDYDFHRAMWNAWKAQDKRFVYTIEGEEKKIYDEYLYSDTEFRRFPKHVQEANKALERYVAGFTFFKYSGLQTVSVNEISEADLEILERFGKVFEQAYTRFLDLQKAEAQSREAQIELALERVRARTMAMHNSEELKEVIQVVYDQFVGLEINVEHAGFILDYKEREDMHIWLADHQQGVPSEITIPYFDSPHWNSFREAKAKGDSFFYNLLDFEEKNKFYKDLFELIPSLTEEAQQAIFRKPALAISTVLLDNVGLYIEHYSEKPFTAEENKILMRFGNVFQQTYTRFLDLQKAETQAKEAQIELSLERIRAQVTAMQASADLLDIVVTMRSEFVKLGYEANYFWHMRWLPEIYEKAMTSGDGSKIGMIMSLPRRIHGDIPKVAAWEKGKDPVMVLDMDTEIAVDYVDKMINWGDFEQVDPHAPTLDDIRHIQGLTFVMARTTHGEIGYSLPGEVPDPPKDAVNTLVRFAGVFDLAYKRFEDLKTAEKDLIEIKAARQKAEEALIELKATQSQLVQQEKLASLGQLTAGIAHEIKNPLNFVNNFSEVSIEMIEEIIDSRHKIQDLSAGQAGTRLKTEDDEIEDEILEDIKANLKKIHEHGSRANGIVTSMLQHSRGGTGKKEPTDLNALIKEYSNLAFHGMRAGKTPINVAIDLQLDEQIKEVSLIGEDFSRVLLNLCNNAFDAMRATADERPTKLTIRTKLQSEKILIEVEDNGSGIPDEIKDKILQPFFTTKKGTEGTGLGLSITHDIIKAHGGELKVETKVGEGTTFIIDLEKKQEHGF